MDITGQVQEMVDPAVGATITLGGARLEIPPGALAGPAEITLIQMTNPAASLRVDDGGLDGQTFLWDSTYTFISNRQVDLNGPIFLDLPFDPSRLPPGMSASQGSISAVTGGYVVVQGEETSASDTHLRMTIDAPFLPSGPSFSGGARPFGSVPFVILNSGLLAAGATLQGWIATIDDVRSVARYQVLLTEHFRIRYRATGMERAQAVADLLEDSYAYFVDELGFGLPNRVNLDGLYTIYLDDFASHSFGSLGFPDGMTLPGSVLVEGASYINVADGKLTETYGSVAVHEYFHQLQYGALSRIAPNVLGNAADLQSGWLFEGTAALMAGRMTGGNLGPRIDRSLQEHASPRWSIFAIPRAVDPPNDAAQELFFYIERELGTTEHYRSMFELLGTDLPFAGEREPSVSAVEEVLRARGSSLGEMYAAWVRDYLFDRPSDYGTEPPPEVPAPLDVTGARPVQVRLTLPALSYDHRVYTVPETTDTTEDDAPTDVEIAVTVTSGDPDDAVIYVELDGEVEELQPVDVGVEVATVLFRVRTDFVRRVRLGILNRGLDDGAALNLDLFVNLGGDGGPPPDGIPDAEEGIVVYTAERGAEVQLRGSNIADGSTWVLETEPSATPRMLGASSDGAVLVGEYQDDALQRLLVVDDFGRGTSRDILPTCAGLVGNAFFGRIARDGRVWLIGDVDFAGTNRPAIFRDGVAGCSRIPIDFDGDGRDDTGTEGTVYSAIAIAQNGTRLALQGPGMTFYTAPASGGRADATVLDGDALVDDSTETTFAIAEDGSALTASFLGGLSYVPADGSDAIALDASMRTGGVVFVADQIVFPMSTGFVSQRPEQDPTVVQFPDEVRPSGPLIRSPESNLLCFAGRDGGTGDESAYCARASGAGLVRVVMPVEGIAYRDVHYWPDR